MDSINLHGQVKKLNLIIILTMVASDCIMPMGNLPLHIQHNLKLHSILK